MDASLLVVTPVGHEKLNKDYRTDQNQKMKKL